MLSSYYDDFAVVVTTTVMSTFNLPFSGPPTYETITDMEKNKTCDRITREQGTAAYTTSTRRRPWWRKDAISNVHEARYSMTRLL